MAAGALCGKLLLGKSHKVRKKEFGITREKEARQAKGQVAISSLINKHYPLNKNSSAPQFITYKIPI